VILVECIVWMFLVINQIHIFKADKEKLVQFFVEVTRNTHHLEKVEYSELEVIDEAL